MPEEWAARGKAAREAAAALRKKVLEQNALSTEVPAMVAEAVCGDACSSLRAPGTCRRKRWPPISAARMVLLASALRSSRGRAGRPMCPSAALAAGGRLSCEAKILVGKAKACSQSQCVSECALAARLRHAALVSDVKWLRTIAPEDSKPARAGCGGRLGGMGTILDQVARTVDDSDA